MINFNEFINESSKKKDSQDLLDELNKNFKTIMKKVDSLYFEEEYDDEEWRKEDNDIKRKVVKNLLKLQKQMLEIAKTL